MQKLRLSLTILLTVLLVLSCISAAWGDNGADVSSISTEGKDWDELVAAFLEQYGIKENGIGIGYKNLVSGEEQYYNADSYMVAGSMYKVPLNMVFAEMVSTGEITEDTKIGGYEYSFLREQTIVHSNNDMAEPMWNKLGGYGQYRRTIAPLMGEDADTVDQMFYKNNYFTPRQMINCLSLLYNDSGKYPGVIDCMQRAEPSNYFRLKENRYTIAHKYGYLSDDTRGHFYLNDCAIVWTDEPFALVVFTDNVRKPYDVLADFITLACDYTQYWTPIRLAEEEQERQEAERLAAEEAARLEAEQLAAEEAARLLAEQQAAYEQSVLTLIQSNGTVNSGAPLISRLYAMAVITGVLLLIVFILMRKRINLGFGIIVSLLTSAALILCVRGSAGPLRAKYNGNPEETVIAFFDTVSSGQLDDACQYLYDCSGFGLEEAFSSEASSTIANALCSSYSYKFSGRCSQNGIEASCAVMLSHLDVSSLCDEAERIISGKTESLNQQYPDIEVYDDEGKLTEDVMNAAYCSALDEAASDLNDNLVSDVITVNLRYNDGAWLIICDDALVNAISGGLK